MGVWEGIKAMLPPRTAPVRPSPPSEGEPTETELMRRVNLAALLSTLPANKAFAEYVNLVFAEVEKARDELVDMKPEDLAGLKGVAAQSFIRGMVFALAQVAGACKAGLEAGRKLESVKAKQKSPLTQVTQIR
ncbi:MAG: hypothetical protein HZC54_00745 [Verrucomicrobia bacterium]|nr:hypothetical protein [Verrucomicrobiota bacterium]